MKKILLFFTLSFGLMAQAAVTGGDILHMTVLAVSTGLAYKVTNSIAEGSSKLHPDLGLLAALGCAGAVLCKDWRLSGQNFESDQQLERQAEQGDDERQAEIAKRQLWKTVVFGMQMGCMLACVPWLDRSNDMDEIGSRS